MAAEPHIERKHIPAREIPSMRRSEARMGLYPLGIAGVTAFHSVSSIDALAQYRTEETKRNQEQALRLCIEDCEDLLDDLKRFAEQNHETPNRQQTPETLHKHINESLTCLLEDMKANERIWKQGTVLRKMTANDLEALKKICDEHTPSEALIVADQYLLGSISLTELCIQTERDHRESISQAIDARPW
ncbi:MAG: hypothetical protein IJ234_01280 [Clostridia bacterium]|nr:hypothetical protein [Clostridia bacterium]